MSLGTAEGLGTGPFAGETGAPFPAQAPASRTIPPLPSSPRGIRASLVVLYRVMRANPLTLVGFVLVVALALAALVIAGVPAVTGYLAEARILPHSYSVLPYGPNQLFTTNGSQAPSWAHPFGTDQLGEDMFTRVLWALPLDLSLGLLISGIAVVAGGGLGLVSGFWDRPGSLSGASSAVILRTTDVFLAIPSMILALAITSTINGTVGSGILPILIALSATWWPYYVRLVRGEVLTIKHQTYIAAARAAGVRDGWIVIRHVIRNVLEPLVVYFTLDVGSVIVTFSTLAFVVRSIPPTIPEWGSMVEFYQNFLVGSPWLVLFPGIAIFVTVLAFSLLGDGLQEVLDPRRRRAFT